MIVTTNFKIIKPTDFSSEIKSDSKIIIFWDTCGILDIFNLVSDSTSSGFLKVLLGLNKKISNGEIISCTSKMIIQEIVDNYNEPYKKASKFLDETIRSYNKVQSYMQELGLQNAYIPVALNTTALLNIIEKQIQSLLDKTIFIEDDNYLKLARDRVVLKIAPGQRNEFKDCVIWETCLEVANTTSLAFHFISSNEKDYGNNGNRYDNIKNDMGTKIQFKHKIHDFYSII